MFISKHQNLVEHHLPDWYPRFHITCITHKQKPVYPATIVGIPPQEDAWLIKASERIFLAPMKMTMVPEIIDMDMPVEGVFHKLVITKIKKDYAGQGQKVMNAMCGAGQMMFNKILVIADEEAIKALDQSKTDDTNGEIFKKTYDHYRERWRYTMYDFGNHNLAAFTTGIGDGRFATYIGFDAKGQPCRLVTDFNIFDWRSKQ